MTQPSMSGPRTGDAFGALLLACHESGARPGAVLEVVEREDGHVRVNDAARYFQASWGALDDWVYARVEGESLDIGCGAGRHALALQGSGRPVCALDPSAGAIEVCRRRGVTDAVEGTTSTLGDDGRFDTVLLLGNNLGLLAGRDQAPGLLADLARLGHDRTRVLATGVGREPGSVHDEVDLTYRRRNLDRGRLPWQVTMRSRFSDLATAWFDYAFLTAEELDGLLAGSAWRVTDRLVEGPAYAVELARA